MMNAGIYARISSDRDGTQLGVNRQLEDCRKLAAQKGWSVTDEYVDNDVSAYSRVKRPEYSRLINDILSHRIDALVVYNADRLNRRPRDLEDLIDVAETAGLRDLAIVTGDIDLSTDQGRLLARLLAAVSANESESKARRIVRKHEELAAKGKYSGGSRPYGYEADGKTVRPDEAAVIHEAAGRILAGDSLRAICLDFDERGVPTPTAGKPWSPFSLRRILKSGRISGQREHKGVIVAKAEWPAIVDPITTQRLRVFFNDPARRTNRTPRRYLLTGLLICGRCGAKLVARPRQGRGRSYACMKGPGFLGCGHVSTMAAPVEDWIIEAVLYRLDTPELAKALAHPDDAAWDQPLAVNRDAYRENLNELARLHGEGTITLQEWLAARKPIEERINEADRQLARASRTTALAGFVGDATRLRTLWHDLPLSRQQAVIKALLESATVMPSSRPRGYQRFDPARVKPLWRV
jgi:DNA invertase Pin-like site-specific DNA recombinase